MAAVYSSKTERPSTIYVWLIYMSKQVATALEYLEGSKIIHQDLATR